MSAIFQTPLTTQRYCWVQNFLSQETTIKTVTDVGCSYGRMIFWLKHVSNLEVVNFIDKSLSTLEDGLEHNFQPNLYEMLFGRKNSEKRLDINVFHGDIVVPDDRLKADCFTMVEFIEHLPLDHLEQVCQTVFGYYKPRYIIVTTPNVEFNPLIREYVEIQNAKKMEQVISSNSPHSSQSIDSSQQYPNGFRHYDHKFEWTRAEFASWAEIICQTYSYEVMLSGVGELPGSEKVGYCTQIALFKGHENTIDTKTSLNAVTDAAMCFDLFLNKLSVGEDRPEFMGDPTLRKICLRANYHIPGTPASTIDNTNYHSGGWSDTNEDDDVVIEDDWSSHSGQNSHQQTAASARWRYCMSTCNKQKIRQGTCALAKYEYEFVRWPGNEKFAAVNFSFVRRQLKMEHRISHYTHNLRPSVDKNVSRTSMAKSDLTKVTTKTMAKMLSINCYLSILLLTTCAASYIIKPVIASGVFELELLNLQRYDQQVTKSQDVTSTSQNRTLSSSSVSSTSTTTTSQQHLHQPVRLTVCLKEAYASQLDGPCTFGNATLTSGLLSHKQDQELQHQHQQQQQQQHQQQVVRIQFTFRWTKSFTIVLAIEQLGQATALATSNSSEPQQQQQQKSSNSLSGPSGSAGIDNSDSGGRVTVIDRHVLTENEVLPTATNAAAAATTTTTTTGIIGANGDGWISRYQRSLKSAISYRFRVYCAPNYYGDGCTTFCRSRSDQFGHYNCSQTGQKLCHDGWRGPDCDRARCRLGCNQLHGHCDQQPDTCQCRPGWTGERCDECIAYPGCQNGFCLKPWQCICHQNWGGFLCNQDLNYCGSHEPCRNNGTCQNVAPGRYKCLCPEGYTGVNCETNLSAMSVAGASLNTGLPGSLTQLSAGCALNPCLNGGTCYGFNAAIASFTGPMENQSTSQAGNEQLALVDSSLLLLPNDAALETPSSAAAAAPATTTTTLQQHQLNQNFMYRCQCPPGWTGDYCQWAESLSAPPTDLVMFDHSVGGGGVSSTTSSLLQYTNDTNPSISSAFSSTMIPQQNEQQQPPSADDTTMMPSQMLSNESNSISMETSNYASSEQQQQLTTVVQHLTTVTSGNQQALEMKHLISGVVVASAVGVFVAALMLAWCCLVAIEKNRFSFIQMNVIRQSSSAANSSASSSSSSSSTSCPDEHVRSDAAYNYSDQVQAGAVVSSKLRRMQEKIRNSFRSSQQVVAAKCGGQRGSGIKPETKLSIENVLKNAPKMPPPSYEESNYNYIARLDYISAAIKQNNGSVMANWRGASDLKSSSNCLSNKTISNDNKNYNNNNDKLNIRDVSYSDAEYDSTSSYSPDDNDDLNTIREEEECSSSSVSMSMQVVDITTNTKHSNTDHLVSNISSISKENTNNEVVVPIEAITGLQNHHHHHHHHMSTGLITTTTPDNHHQHITNSHLSCPKHGHLYRKQQQLYASNTSKHLAASSLPTAVTSTTIEIEYKPNKNNHYQHHEHQFHQSSDLG